ncbi:ABC transporter ATP-binding protein/permease [Marinomonas spartinae]|uniref:ABC transporter ATP-binding protein/permease n=1 Tax=Marinomonas spartinae TaxID=1792290 RepID=UPI0018F27328|nr:ATP-binding cassette domain-containing protein [Marinomonas spartinae]MBJ7556572.1 ABC transporter ATP-binding protein/permease [Marinomonas spartinae]
MAIMLSELENDKQRHKLNWLFFRRALMLAKPYWTRKGAWKSWLVVVFICLMIAGFSWANAYVVKLTGEVTDALVDKKSSLYWSLFTWSTLFGVIIFGARVIQSLVGALLSLHWWRWLTEYLIGNYLYRQTYFHILQDEKIDNPDQRIEEEVGPVCDIIGAFPLQVLGSISNMGVQTSIMVSISSSLFFCVIGFSIFQSLAIYLMNQPIIKQQFDITVAEADLRYGITYVRNNAENIAFYRGEETETNNISARMKNVVKKQMRNMIYSIYLNLMNDGVGVVWNYLPLIVLVPMYFNGEISYGTIAQATASATLLVDSLTVLSSYIPQLSQAVPHMVRVAEIHEAFLKLKSNQQDPDNHIVLKQSDTIQLKDVNLKTPKGEQSLVNQLNLQLNRDCRLIIVGRSGVGKSSLLRAIAGLWSNGTGTISLPMEENTCLFLPQRPYTFEGDLRSQLYYPAEKSPVNDDELKKLLNKVCLEDLLTRHGSLDTVKDWPHTLSLGEQQRIAFLRVLLLKARYVFLDESTSAVDLPTEKALYKLLETTGSAWISVGHRPSLLPFHNQAMHLQKGGQWTIRSIEELAEHEDDI